MYSRSTDRGGKRVHLPPGYDGSTFRHDTGEMRRYRSETEMKIHSPVLSEERWEEPAQHTGEPDRWEDPGEETAEAQIPAEETEEKPTENREREDTGPVVLPVQESRPDGLLTALGSEEWLLLLVILLLLADGSDAWDTILILGLLLAVRTE